MTCYYDKPCKFYYNYNHIINGHEYGVTLDLYSTDFATWNNEAQEQHWYFDAIIAACDSRCLTLIGMNPTCCFETTTLILAHHWTHERLGDHTLRVRFQLYGMANDGCRRNYWSLCPVIGDKTNMNTILLIFVPVCDLGVVATQICQVTSETTLSLWKYRKPLHFTEFIQFIRLSCPFQVFLSNQMGCVSKLHEIKFGTKEKVKIRWMWNCHLLDPWMISYWKGPGFRSLTQKILRE